MDKCMYSPEGNNLEWWGWVNSNFGEKKSLNSIN